MTRFPQVASERCSIGAAASAGAINTAIHKEGFTAMDTQELDDLTEEEDEVTAHRARAKTELDQIKRLVKHALVEQRIDLDLFFLTPNSGEAILMFGSPANPDDSTWERVSDIVSAILRQVVGLDGTRCRPVMCSTTTDDMVGNEQSLMPIPTPTLQNTGVEQ
jgi:hypothetical protein